MTKMDRGKISGITKDGITILDRKISDEEYNKWWRSGVGKHSHETKRQDIVDICNKYSKFSIEFESLECIIRKSSLFSKNSVITIHDSVYGDHDHEVNKWSITVFDRKWLSLAKELAKYLCKQDKTPVIIEISSRN